MSHIILDPESQILRLIDQIRSDVANDCIDIDKFNMLHTIMVEQNYGPTDVQKLFYRTYEEEAGRAKEPVEKSTSEKPVEKSTQHARLVAVLKYHLGRLKELIEKSRPTDDWKVEMAAMCPIADALGIKYHKPAGNSFHTIVGTIIGDTEVYLAGL